jgi:FkbM family methyltransferase
MLRVPVLEKTPQGLALYIDDATHFVFCGKKPMRWLGGRCANGYHEPIMSQLLIEYLRAHPTAVFFDVGALFGYFGLLALAVSKGEAKIFEFEMNPRAFAALNENFAANTHLRREAIVAFQGAVGDIEATQQMTKYKGMTVDSTDTRARQVPMDFLTLDGFCRRQHISPDLMKIDVEGYEGKILNGARRVMRESDTVTMLELHSNSKLKASGITRCELLENLLGDGWGLYYFGRHRYESSVPVRRLSREYLNANRTYFDSRGDDLVVISKKDIRTHWPQLEFVES